MTETPREPAPDGTSGTSFVDTSRLAERADIDESPASEGASSSHENVSLSNADLPEPKLPPITSVVIDIGDDRVEVFHRDSGPDDQPDNASSDGGVDVPGVNASLAGEQRERAAADAADDPGAADAEPHPEAAPTGRPTYVLVHGLGGSLANWEPLWPFLTEHGRVLALDLAGFGRTSGSNRSAVSDNVDLLAAYLRQLGLSDVVLVGNSMGGMIVAMMTAKHPELVSRLVLVDPVLPLHPQDRPHWSVLVTFSLYMCPPAARRVIPRYAARRGIDRMGVEGVLTVVADPHRVPKWVMRRSVEEVRALAENQDAVPGLVRAANSLVVAAGSPRYRRVLSELRVPVTLVHGERDRLVPVSAARRIAARHPAWTFLEGPGLGHVPIYEAAGWVARCIVGAAAS